MQLELKIKIDAETNEYWCFNLFDLNAVFVRYVKESKPNGKRAWKTISYWDKYQRPDYNMIEEPEMPDEIRQKALTQIISKIKVQTWAEYKQN